MATQLLVAYNNDNDDVNDKTVNTKNVRWVKSRALNVLQCQLIEGIVVYFVDKLIVLFGLFIYNKVIITFLPSTHGYQQTIDAVGWLQMLNLLLQIIIL